MSYGLDGFSCRVLPVIFPISIGSDSDQVFMHELASFLHMPEAFVSTEATMQGEIDGAMNTLRTMLTRVSQVFSGLAFDQNGSTHAIGMEEHNLFNHRERALYFTVPNAASNLRLCTAVGEQALVVPNLPIQRLDKKARMAVRNEYVQYRLMEMKVAYSSATQALAGGIPQTRSSRGSRFAETAAVAPEDTANEAKFTELKRSTQDNLRSLLSLKSSTETKRNVELFISQIEQHKSISTPIQSVGCSREDAAQFTQSRLVGNPVAAKAAPAVTIVGTVFEDIRHGEFDKAGQKLAENPLLVNSTSPDKYAATPLIATLVKMNLIGTTEPLRKLFGFLTEHPDTNLAAQDASGNTALHRAAWCGLFYECVFMIQTANTKNQLAAIKRVRNNASVGATRGESILDNIRRSTKLTIEQKKTLQREFSFRSREADPTSATVDFNSHTEENWNTPLMDKLKLLSTSRGDQSIDLRAEILALLDTQDIDFLESNFLGDTALHYAIWFCEFGIAKRIVTKTPPEDLTLLLSARNSVALSLDTGGETPLMNLASAGQRAFIHFMLEPTPHSHSNLQDWLGLCEMIKTSINPAQHAELSHLMQVYGKQLQGYNAGNVLLAAPINALGQLQSDFDSLGAQHPALQDDVRRLKEKLQELMESFSNAKADEFTASLAGEIQSASEHLLELYRRTNETVIRFKDYVNGRSADLEHMAAAVPPVPTRLTPKQRVETLLIEFETKIAAIGQHQAEARGTATALLLRLRGHVTQASELTMDDLKQTVHDEIARDLPELQRDLGWGDYLLNLAKNIVNVVMRAVSLGRHQGFFALEPSFAAREALAVAAEINNLVITL